MAQRARGTRWLRGLGSLAVFLVFSVGVVLLMLWLAGKFEAKVAATAAAEERTEPVGKTVAARRIAQPSTETAVGTIRAVHETSVGSKLLARVLEVNLKAGQKVNEGDVLVRLDDSDLRAKLQQAKATLSAAEAQRRQAASDEKRAAELAKTNVVTAQDYDRIVTELHSAEAGLARAREAINEVQATLDWATIRAPLEGIVIDKKVDVGDTVTPGQILVTLFDPRRMQLVASVRESLAQRLQIDQGIEVHIDGLNKRCSGKVSEIVPEAQSASRAFQVKVTGPCAPGVYTGMFGRLLIPLEKEELLVIPREAVSRVGQLELVEVVADGRARRRAIRTGRTVGEDLEVLSGLREGELVRVAGEGGHE